MQLENARCIMKNSKRWIVIAAVLTTLGIGGAIAGCANASYTDHGGGNGTIYCNATQGDYTCNQCAWGDNVYNCDDTNDWGGCLSACTSNCVGNCVEQNCNNNSSSSSNTSSNGGSGLFSGCSQISNERTLIEGEDYEIDTLRAFINSDTPSGCVTIEHKIRLLKTFKEANFTLYVLSDGNVIGQQSLRSTQSNSSLFNGTTWTMFVTVNGSVNSSNLELRIGKAVGEDL